MLGGWLALVAAACFAFSNVSTRRAVITGNVVQGLSITIPIGVPLFLIATLVTGTVGAVVNFGSTEILFLSAAGILHFVLGRYCNYRAIGALGANLVAPIQQSILLVALVLAVSLLGEVLTPLRILGIVLVLLGPAIMLRGRNLQGGRGGKGYVGAEKFRPRYLEGYGFALLSALAYGASPVVVRAALEGASPGTAIAGGLVSYLAATIVVAPVLLHPAARRHIGAMERHNAKWFAIGGTATVTSQMLRYTALSIAPVSVVATVMRLDVVFRYLFSWLVNPNHEVFGLRIIGAMLISLIGALALTLSTEFVLSLFPLPDFLIAAARWQWP